MVSIKTRAGKGSPLTWTELDANFTAIKAAIEALQNGSTPTPSPTLNALTLAASTIAENSAAGTGVGGLLGTTSGSTLTLSDSAGGRFALSGTTIVAGLVSTNFETATSHNVTVVETLAGATGSPRPTTLTITVSNVFEQPNLSSLSLSSTSLTVGTAASGSISGATAGSTITASGLPSGLTVNGAARTWSYDGTGTAGSSTIALIETLSDSANNPRESDVTVTKAPPPVTTGPITFDPLVTKAGDVYTFTARRSTNLANAETRQITVAGSTTYQPAATAADFGGTFPTPVVSFAAGAATAAFQITSPNAQPE